MENYGPGLGAPATYLIQGAEPTYFAPAAPLEIMGTEGAFDQSLYYPTASYGYYYTGLEPHVQWDDQNRMLSFNGQNLQYPGSQTESLPYLYYSPSYGYAESPYNPYNPYIPGAVVGANNPYGVTQQYYAGTMDGNPTASPVVQLTPDIMPSMVTQSQSTNAQHVNWNDTRSLKPNTSLDGSTDIGYVQASTFGGKSLEVSKASSAVSNSSVVNTNIASRNGVHSTLSQTNQGRVPSSSIRSADRSSSEQVSSFHIPFKVSQPAATTPPNFASNRGWAVADRLRPYGGVSDSRNGYSDLLGDQNRGPRTSRLKSQWSPSVSTEAYSTMTETCKAQEKIIIYESSYNKDDFQLNYLDAKFYVIKSYSEDDVHKSMKYNVWSSTPTGNKRLGSAYEDAQRIAAVRPKGCPIFLFFSVNASGQFCGVAEMIGPVDFNKDMNFWQQDKWSGSFPVKWHFVKDVPNTSVRHIILENNENKPVTNSRDTQEIRYKQGMEMLNIFKNYVAKTSLLDDFMYYEGRQKIMQEEKARMYGKGCSSSYISSALVPINVVRPLADNPSGSGKTGTGTDDVTSAKSVITMSSSSSSKGNVKENVVADGSDDASILNIGSLSIGDQSHLKLSIKDDEQTVVTSALKSELSNGVLEASTPTAIVIGTIPIVPRVSKFDKPST